MMVIPVSQHKLIKIRRKNRKKLTSLALYSSFLACFCNVLGSSTNNWLSTSEVLKYYVFPNNTQNYDDTLLNTPVYFKNASIGPWQFCWLDPQTDFHCNSVSYIQDEDPSDVTTSVQQSVRRSFFFMMSGMILDILGLLLAFVCVCLPNPYASLFFSTLVHIFAGIANFSCIIVYMSAVSKEVGNKIFPASEMDTPLFYFDYGYSFILIKSSFIMTEMAALFSIVVYMAKRDERTFNRYKLRSLLNTHKAIDDTEPKECATESYYQHSRFNQLRRPGSTCSQAPSLEAIIKPNSPTPSLVPRLRQSAQDAYLPAVFMMLKNPSSTSGRSNSSASSCIPNQSIYLPRNEHKESSSGTEYINGGYYNRPTVYRQESYPGLYKSFDIPSQLSSRSSADDNSEIRI